MSAITFHSDPMSVYFWTASHVAAEKGVDRLERAVDVRQDRRRLLARAPAREGLEVVEGDQHLGLLERVAVDERRARLLLFLPYAVPSFISILIFKGLFNQNLGEINLILDGLFGIKPAWFSDTTLHWRPATYWPAHTKATLKVDFAGVNAGKSLRIVARNSGWVNYDDRVVGEEGDPNFPATYVFPRKRTGTKIGRAHV